MRTSRGTTLDDPDLDARCSTPDSDVVELLIEARPRDLGGFPVRRVLPSLRRRLVGPFVFFDHMGPMRLAPGAGMDVRPHPHIGLATVTFLFEGTIDHKDSLGTAQSIAPGDVNWMTAGRGIAHSERSSPAARLAGVQLHGIQSWVALPREHEEVAPSFVHYPAAALPRVSLPGARLDIVAGAAWGARSPVGVLWPTLYAHAQLDAGARLPVAAAPAAASTTPQDHEERAVYVVEGSIGCEALTAGAGTMLVLRPGVPATLEAREGPARVMVLGGAQLPEPRFVWWNFVSSSRERLERAKADWREARFGVVPGDELERIPLPEG
jgi:redox-sensitive bicupin YhaK (pirin superfamily)